MAYDPPRFSTVSALASPHDRRVHVDDPELFDVQDVLRVTRTGEMMRVTELDGRDLLVQRGIASDPCALEQGDEILRVGSVA